MRQERLIFRLGEPLQRLPEVPRVDRRGKEMHVRMPMLFGAVEARPASEDHLRPRQELPLAFDKLGRRKIEGGELVHAVENDDLWRTHGGQRQCHRRVHPQEAPLQVLFPHEALDKLGQILVNLSADYASRARYGVDVGPGLASAHGPEQL